IGKPVANTQFYLLDEHGQPVPLGVPGEIYIGGAGVARGYLNRDDLTAERFLNDPFSSAPNARMYRTGDLGRYLPDGNIEYLGRNDDQVKIRGFRIELGEIEAKLAQHPSLKETVVLAREDVPGDKRLVAYFTQHSPDEVVDIETLRTHLQAQLPAYMVPVAYVRLDALPLTPNGKLDRKALPAPDLDALITRGYEAPQGETETTLAQIWQDLLGLEQVGRHDHFFELGGHSLLAVTLIERMRQVGLSADVRVLFGQPTLAALAAAVGGGSEIVVPANGIPLDCTRITPDMLTLTHLDQHAIDRIVATVPGGARNVQEIYPVAPLQEGILYHHLSAEQGDPYLLQTLFALQSRQRLDDFVQALQSVIDRHDILRTAILWEGLDEPQQVVWREAQLGLEQFVPDPHAGEIVQQLHNRFDARYYSLDMTQAPLMRLAFAEDKPNQRWIAMLLFHHIALDHAALKVVQQEMQAHLLGQVDGLDVPVPYRNYVAQARLGVNLEEQEGFFREMLGDVDEPTLPFGLQQVQGDGHDIELASLVLDGDLSGRLRRLARQSGVGAASLHHLAWAHVLGQVSGKQDVVFGTVLMGRMQGGQGADRALGMFINTLPLRVNLGEQSVKAGVKAVHGRLTALLGHEHASLALAQRCSGVVAPLPLFSALLNYRNSSEQADAAQTLAAWHGIETLGGEARTNYPLTMCVDDLGEDFMLSALVVQGIGAERICAYMHTALESLVQALEQAPQTPLNRLEILPDKERNQLLVDFNATKRPYPQDQTVLALFEAQAAHLPQAIAVVHGQHQVSYGELNERANRLAHYLLGLGVQPDDCVAILLPRSIDLLTSQLAILKCAAAYVPLDRNASLERQGFMLEDCQAKFLLTFSSEAVPEGTPRVDLDTLDTQGSFPNPALEQSSESIAYIMYTSGSTGQPKGVLVPHRAINRLVINNGYADFNAHDRIAFASNPAFDASTMDVWGALLNGGQVVVIDHETLLEPSRFAQVLGDAGVTVLFVTTAIFNQYVQLIPQAIGGLRILLCGGERADVASFQRLLSLAPGLRLVHCYGPTETTTYATTLEVKAVAADAQSVPIGGPISNTQVYVLDARQQLAPLGVVGEIYIGGQGVAKGYLNRADLTAEKFIANPFSHEPGALLYRTGDLGRWLPEGSLECLGRNDDQVKVRGFRIELGEIEAKLVACDGVKDAVVLVRADEPGEKRLVAYVIAQPQVTLSVAALREQLSATLANYMVPAAFVMLPAFPLTLNGKVDRKALPVPQAEAYASQAYEVPQGEIEQTLAGMWAELLKVERVGRHDNFFELGGHSLLAVTLIERMRQADLSADVRVLFSQPTLAALAAAIGSGREVSVPANLIAPGTERITPAMLTLIDLDQEAVDRVVATVPGGARNVQDIYPLAPLQDGILYHHLAAEQGDPYVLKTLFDLRNRDRLMAFVDALQHVIDRHDILRTSVVWQGFDAPIQVVWREAQLHLEEVSLDSRAGDIAAQLQSRFDPQHYRLDITQAPLMRLVFAQDAVNQRWVAVLLFHHMALDHTALEVVQQEMQAHLLGQAAQLGESVPYRNYVAQARLGVSQQEHEGFFREMLGDVDEPTLPFGLQDVSGDGQAIEQARQVVEATLSLRLRAQARQLGVSAASLVHLAWAQVLGRVSGKDDVVFGTILLGRMQGGDGADRALGMFINTLPLRVDISTQGVRDGVKATHARLTGLLGHEHASLALAQRCSGVVAPLPLFSALLNYRHSASAAAVVSSETLTAWEGIELLSNEERTNYPLTLSVDDLGEGFMLSALVAQGIGAERICVYMHTALESLVQALEQAPQTPLNRLEILPDKERNQLLVDFNATKRPYPQDQTVLALFEAQAAHLPQAIAVVHGQHQVSYGELNERANRLAHYLLGLGVQPDDCVAILLPRSIDLLTSQLAILKCAAAYVPLDRNASLERQGFMLEDCQAKFLLTFSSEAVPEGTPRVDLDTLDTQGSFPNPALEQSSESIAYIMYTSGSTGQPKGVLVPHRAINRLVINNGYADFNAHDRIAFASNPAFDASTMDVWGALLNGGQVVVIDHETLLEPSRFAQVLGDAGVTVLFVTTAIFNQYVQLIPQAIGGLRILLCGGERADVASFQRLLSLAPGLRLVHCYGPTETTTYATTLEVKAVAADAQSVPIGGPISNTQVYVLDARQQLAPLGVVGEIYIGGQGVAKGYLNRADLTAEKFIANPFSHEPGALLYRTGDLGRWLPEGSLECLGRNDDQVKVRGFRIELGEIEAKLVACDGVKDAVVLVRADEPGEKRLVAYVIAQPQVTLSVAALREQLSATLANYMVPAAFVMLPAFPLTLNGKVDRKALPVPQAEAYASQAYEVPQGEIEQTLAGMWAELLKVERVGRHDNFFELGGHSLLAVTLIERMRQAGLSADVRVLFGQPTLAALAAAIGSGREVSVPANLIAPGSERITPAMLTLIELDQVAIDRVVATVPGGARNVQDIYPLAPLQEGILYHHLAAEQGDPYVLQMQFAFDNRERLDAFVGALQVVIDRHDILRTSVVWEGLDEPMQVVWRQAVLEPQCIVPDATAGDIATQLASRFGARHYRLDLGQAPLLHLAYARDEAQDRWVAILLFHHMALDHTAMDVMQQEMQLHLLGQDEQLGEAMPYRNYVAQACMGASEEEHEAFFREMLGDIDEPTLPFGLQDVQGDGRGIEEDHQDVDADLSRRVRAQARQLGVSAASVYHLVWAHVLGRVSGREDVVFGTVFMGRMQGGEGADRALGMFINTLPLRVNVGQTAVRAGVKATHARLTALLGHEHASLVLAQRCSGVEAPTPLFSALLNYRHTGVITSSEALSAWDGMQVLGAEERTNYPLTLSVDDQGEGFSFTVMTPARIGAQRLSGYVQQTLEALIQMLEQTPGAPLNQLSILPASEREQLLVAFNATQADYPQAQTVHGLFEEQVQRTPEAVAVIRDGQRLSYRQLNERANRLAHYLRKQGVQPDSRVAICVERGIDMVVGLLAILKAGGGYVPLDPAYPLDRIAYMLEDSAPAAVLAQAATLELLAEASMPVINLDSGLWQDESVQNPEIAGLTSSHLAYVIYTSGSTGLPKGVMIEHRNTVNFLTWAHRSFDAETLSKTLFSTSLNFDLAVYECFAPLTCGGSIEVVTNVLELQQGAHDITLINTVPSALKALLESGGLGEGVDTVNVAGEALKRSLVEALFEQTQVKRLCNLYGPSETTTYSSWVSMAREDGFAAHIGKPVANTQFYLLDEHKQPVPLGVPGEIYIGGAGVARGYLNRDDLTAERFLKDPFSPTANTRMYKTGDLGRYLPDGNIEYLGRNDDQVKIRGFRIELGEIEAKLAQHPSLKETVILAREDVPGDKRLVAYFTQHSPDETVDIEALRTHLQAQLPAYMVPAAYVRLDALPLTPNGKLDRKALPFPDLDALITRGYEAPQGEVETTLAQIWQDLLKVERVGRHDHFFELGGHSLLAVKLIERMRHAGLSADVRELFGQPTLAALAAAVGGHTEVVVPVNRIALDCQRITPDMLPLATLSQDEIDRVLAMVPGGIGNVQDIYALAPLQEGILYHHLAAAQGDPYLQYVMFAFDSFTRLDHFTQALQAVVARHDILRTGMLWEGLAEPMQVVWREARLTVEPVELDLAAGDVTTQLHQRFDPRHYRLDVRQAPLMRVAYAQDPANQRWVGILLFHHLVDDATSLAVLSAEIEAHLLGQADRLPASVPYRNYVAQARLGVSREAHEKFFRDMLGDVDEPTLPFGLQDVHGDGSGIEEVRQDVEADLSRRLRTQARQLGVSAASLYHLVWAQVLGKVSGKDDVVFGTVLVGRMQGGEGSDRALGMFINTLPLRVSLGQTTAGAGVKATHARLTALLGHEHASLVLAQRCSGVEAPTPLFSALLNYRHTGAISSTEALSAWDGMQVLSGEERTNYPLTLAVDDQGEGFSLSVMTPAGIGAQRICGYVRQALENLIEMLEQAPQAPLHQLSILPPGERLKLLAEFNTHAADGPQEQQAIQALFEAQVQRTPDDLAVLGGEQRLSYRQLNERANRLAHYLRKQGVAPDSRVAICVERSVDMVVGLLAVLKAGGGYVPLDPAYPAERIAFMLQDSAPVAVLTQAGTRVLLSQAQVPLIDLDAGPWQDEPDHNPHVTGLTPAHLAYVIYTSGSTGLPKGVMVERRGLGNLLDWYLDDLAFHAGDAVLLASSYNFDLTQKNILAPLMVGAALHLAEEPFNPRAIVAQIADAGITHLNMSPSAFHALVDADDQQALACLQRVVLGGEPIQVGMLEKLPQPRPAVINSYGPTECSDVVAWYTADSDLETYRHQSIPIGRPIRNMQLHVLDTHGQLVPVGVPGEIHIGGVGVARGYLNLPQLSAERFIADPFYGKADARLYKTGDIGRWLPDGTLQYLGRNDDQVKIRGFRIELGEIEAKLAQHEAVKEAAVLVREDVPGEKRLVAYFTQYAPDEAADIEALRTCLQAQLPAFMVPVAYVRLDTMPLTPNGKLNRKVLPAPDLEAFITRGYEAPIGETEITLAQLWAEVLNVERVGRHDHFFGLGGHSLLAVSLMERMRQEGMEADVRTLFEQPTLSEYAAMTEKMEIVL
ncbi:non-ribosomal peptide synthetase, partial [Pseudomonas sp. FW300-N2F2]|uniref:non-ribosomal peptide synthetase n=1 Tax=Pseudomonas sp. FW300-N2F2 TaxID=2751320 RepID=UPI001A9203F7